LQVLDYEQIEEGEIPLKRKKTTQTSKGKQASVGPEVPLVGDGEF